MPSTPHSGAQGCPAVAPTAERLRHRADSRFYGLRHSWWGLFRAPGMVLVQHLRVPAEHTQLLRKDQAGDPHHSARPSLQIPSGHRRGCVAGAGIGAFVGCQASLCMYLQVTELAHHHSQRWLGAVPAWRGVMGAPGDPPLPPPPVYQSGLQGPFKLSQPSSCSRGHHSGLSRMDSSGTDADQWDVPTGPACSPWATAGAPTHLPSWTPPPVQYCTASVLVTQLWTLPGRDRHKKPLDPQQRCPRALPHFPHL